MIRSRVRVHMKDGPTLDGLLLSKRGRHYKLIDATTVAEEPVSFDGEVYVPRENVTALQVLYR